MMETANASNPRRPSKAISYKPGRATPLTAISDKDLTDLVRRFHEPSALSNETVRVTLIDPSQRIFRVNFWATTSSGPRIDKSFACRLNVMPEKLDISNLVLEILN